MNDRISIAYSLLFHVWSSPFFCNILNTGSPVFFLYGVRSLFQRKRIRERSIRCLSSSQSFIVRMAIRAAFEIYGMSLEKGKVI